VLELIVIGNFLSMYLVTSEYTLQRPHFLASGSMFHLLMITQGLHGSILKKFLTLSRIGEPKWRYKVEKGKGFEYNGETS
jgi:hypothetical protein